ncbi:MAG: SusD/RagB family nutrient-binding outer membrane lipoprotein [Chitinophagaceae bacterium]
MKKIAIVAALAVTLFGCRGKDNLFVNPNSPVLGTSATMLTEIEVATINSFEGDINRTGSIYIQHHVGTNLGQGQEAQEYAITQLEQDNNWTQLYATMNNCKLLKENFGATRPYYDGITSILMAMNLGLLTDTYGDAPYSESLVGDVNLYPKFDPQESIYVAIQGLLDDAITKLATAPADNLETPGADMIYAGDPAMWTKAAYTLKARYLNRLSNKPGYDKAAVLDALSKGISSSDGDAMGPHDAASGQNQWYAFQNARTNYLVACETLVDSMQLRPNDLRLYYYFDSTGFGGVVGSPVAATTTSASPFGAYLAGGAATPTPLVTYTEAKFIEAEVKARMGDASTATTLNDAIQASAAKVTGGVYNGVNIATYTAATATLSRVMYEKWIAMYGQTEAYSDYRRTGVPKLIPNPEAALPTIPGRFPMSQQERTSNPNTISLPVTTPVWWAQ